MFLQKIKTISYKNGLISVDQPLVMGILNITLDSYYDGGKYAFFEDALARAESMINQGVDILDLGAASTRPGAVRLAPTEEIQRLIPVIKAIKTSYHIPISIDTFQTQVAEAAFNAGADVLNDISAWSLDDRLYDWIVQNKIPYVLMHMQGNPTTMQLNPTYEKVVPEVLNFLAARIAQLHDAGVHDIMIDPGFGFGKTIEHNYQLLAHLESFRILEHPILVGLSRKSFIYKPLGSTPDAILPETSALHLQALLAGADILRTHDVPEAKRVIKLYQLMKQGQQQDI